LIAADLLMDPNRYRQLVAVMERNGLLEADGGVLRPALDAGTEDTHHVDGTEVTVRPVASARQSATRGRSGSSFTARR